MVRTADDDMVVDSDAKPFACVRNVPGDGDVLFAGRWIAAGVIVDENDRCRTEVDRPADDFADIDG